ncbi:hypothetical protein, partial [Streptomyces scabiei]|uniref:hypothetical protein n=1 Tax=Streptomyces scabiei TaxID=1930 RepID=UPI0038F6AA1E
VNMNNKRQLRFPGGEVLAGIESVLSYDHKTMKGSAKFLINNQECPQILLSSHQAKTFSNFALIKKDLKFCKTALRIASGLASDGEELKQV